ETSPSWNGPVDWDVNMKVARCSITLGFPADGERLKPQLHIKFVDRADLIERRFYVAKPVARRIVIARSAVKPTAILARPGIPTGIGKKGSETCFLCQLRR